MDHIQKIKDDKKVQEEMIRKVLRMIKFHCKKSWSKFRRGHQIPQTQKAKFEKKKKIQIQSSSLLKKESNRVKTQTTRTPY